MILRRCAPLALALLGTGCASPPVDPPPTYHEHVEAIVRDKCAGCHVEGGIAPFALGTYGEVVAMKESIRGAVASRAMPPWLAGAGCNEYAPDRSLTDEQIATVARWVETGAAQGDPAKAPASEGSQQQGLSRVDLHLPMPAAFKPAQAPDDYRCFLVDWPATTTRFVTGFRANPGAPAIVHHVIAFLAKPADVARYQALDDAEPGPGYTCFGGPGGGGGRAAWIGAWAPGSPGSDFPAGTGLRVEPGSKIVLQVHYNTSASAPVEDVTSVDLKLDDTVEKEAFIQPWANPDWVRNRTMHIPAGATDASFRWAFDPSPLLAIMTGGAFQNGKAITLWTAGLHMHTRGTRARLEVERAAGAGAQCLLDIPRWDFHWQGGYGLARPVVVRPGDAIALECHFNNTAPPVQDVNWGEGTGDEMCLGTFYMTQ